MRFRLPLSPESNRTTGAR
jgi:restriction system protein